MEPAAPLESSGVTEAPALVEEPEPEPELEPEPVVLLPLLLPPVVVDPEAVEEPELELEPEVVPEGVGVALVEVARVEVEGLLVEVELVLLVVEVTEGLGEVSTAPSNLMLCQEPVLSE
jgi:hypothetical protein